jgi:hypothetical protein
MLESAIREVLIAEAMGMDEDIRGDLEDELDQTIPDDHWQFLVDELYRDDYKHFDRRERATRLAQDYRELRRRGDLSLGRKGGDRRARFRAGAPWLSANEMTMAAALGEGMAQRAAHIPEIEAQHDRLRDGSSRITADEAARIWREDKAPEDVEPREFIRDLARRFGWRLEDAAIFVLSGWFAPIDPIAGSISVVEFADEYGDPSPRSRARIFLTIDPWVSSDTVLAAYRDLRRQLIGAERKPPEARELEAFRFVVRRLDDSGKPEKGWTALGREWNEIHPDDGWNYGKPGDIRRAYEGVRSRLVNYEYRVAGKGHGSEIPSRGNERGTEYRVQIDPQERTPNDLLPTGEGPARTMRQRAKSG